MGDESSFPKVQKGSVGFVKGKPVLKVIREIRISYLAKIQEFVLKDLECREVAGHPEGTNQWVVLEPFPNSLGTLHQHRIYPTEARG